VDAHRVALAVPDFGRRLEKEAGAFSGRKNDIEVARLCCGVRGGLQTCLDRLKDVRLDKIVTYVTGGMKNGVKRRMRGLREMRIYERGEKGPAGVLCAVDADGVDVSMLVEQRVHDRKGNWMSGADIPVITRLSPMASMHYGTPSSLPSDYALLSRYANARGITNSDEPVHDSHDITEPIDVLDDVLPDRPAIRRSSFPSPYLRPLQPILPEPFASKVSVPDEYTPLLVPRIEEEVSPSTDPVHSQSTAKVYRDELNILLKYTLPVFG